MLITNVSIKNSITVFVLTITIVIVGTISYIQLPREAAPDIKIPVAIISTFYMGVSPTDIETLITDPIERKCKELANIKEITSTSGDSFSTVVVEFVSGTDIDTAIQKVKDKVDMVKPDLPKDAETPQVLEINLSEIPVMVINISGDYGLIKLKKEAENLKDKIETVRGVLDVTISGGMEREIQILADASKLTRFNLSLGQITQAIQAENINIPGGTIDIGDTKYLLRIPGEFKTVKEIENIVVDSPGGSPIHIRDLATVYDTFKEKTSAARMNNRDSVSLSIQKRSGENLIAIADNIRSIIKDYQKNMPYSTEVNLVADRSVDINDMVNELENSIILGLLLVVAVLYAFFGFRNALFVAIAIPLSMLISYTVMQIMGMTLNMVALFSLILVLGILADDAIVMVENIFRHMNEGHNRVDSSRLAAAEVGWPVITSTLTTIAAFVPMLFMPGIVGQFMKYLPMCTIITMSASLFVAMVINPVICATFMVKKPGQEERGAWFKKFEDWYRSVVTKAVAKPGNTLALSVLAFALSIALYSVFNPGFKFFPDTTPSKIYIDITNAQGSTLDSTNQITTSIESLLFNHPNIDRIITTVGSQTSHFFKGNDNPDLSRIIVEFKKESERSENPRKTVAWIREKTKNIPGAEIKIINEEMGPPTGAAIGIKISGKDFDILYAYALKIEGIMKELGGMVDIKDDYVKGRPEVTVSIDRQKAALLGANTAMIASTVRTAFQGNKISTYRDGSDEYDIILKLAQQDRNTINDIKQLIIHAKDGVQLPLMEIANINTNGGVGSINHLDSERVITIEASPAEGRLSSERLKAISEKLKDFKLPDGYKIGFVGENEEMQTMAVFLLKSFIIALMLIAMILITQFNSILLPVIIIFSVFLSLIGILLGLTIFQKPFVVIMTGIGVIALAGVVVKNAIVLIAYINQLRDRGMDKYQAVIHGGAVRLRPVLLTAIVTILGIVPMTFGINFDFKKFFDHGNPFNCFIIGGKSYEFWSSMGSAFTIGLTVGTVLTLVVVPAMYIIFDNWQDKLRKKFK